MQEKVPEYMSDRMLENLLDRMPENMSDRMQERMSDRMFDICQFVDHPKKSHYLEDYASLIPDTVIFRCFV